MRRRSRAAPRPARLAAPLEGLRASSTTPARPGACPPLAGRPPPRAKPGCLSEDRLRTGKSLVTGTGPRGSAQDLVLELDLFLRRGVPKTAFPASACNSKLTGRPPFVRRGKPVRDEPEVVARVFEDASAPVPASRGLASSCLDVARRRGRSPWRPEHRVGRIGASATVSASAFHRPPARTSRARGQRRARIRSLGKELACPAEQVPHGAQSPRSMRPAARRRQGARPRAASRASAVGGRARRDTGEPARGGSRRSRPLDQVVDREPLCEALVKLRTGALRERPVRGIADKEVAKAIALVLGKRGRGRADELLPHERREMRLDRRPTGSGERTATAPRWKTSPSTDPRSITMRTRRRASRSAPGGARGSSGDDDLAVSAVLADHREHLLDIEWVPGRRGGDALPQFAGRAARASSWSMSWRTLGAERLEQQRRRVELSAAPARPRVEQLRACDAEEEDRRVARQVRDVLDEVDEDRLRPLQVVDTTTWGRSAAVPRGAAGTRAASRAGTFR